MAKLLQYFKACDVDLEIKGFPNNKGTVLTIEN